MTSDRCTRGADRSEHRYLNSESGEVVNDKNPRQKRDEGQNCTRGDEESDQLTEGHNRGNSGIIFKTMFRSGRSLHTDKDRSEEER